ncbi:MAG: flagellar motor protein MotB [Burkholderiales bacterium 21-58-4]|nr:MAG: flagellar motor protein MotB [Burkholderiales bacterium 21-58-4]
MIVKVIREDTNPKSGVWKIACADFVTAMMAFFLLMWLISSTSENDLKQIAEYFKTPLSAAFSGGETEDTSTIRMHGRDTDLTRRIGSQHRGPPDLESAKKELMLKETRRLEILKDSLEKAIASNPSIRRYRKQLLIDITANGLRIQIVDEKNRPMFDVGSIVLQPYAVEILHAIGKLLNEVPNRISLSGHTDATPYQGSERNYNNWDLSIDRANASRRELIIGGMDPDKVMRVIGLASAVPLDRKDPFDPINRRISIIVMKKEAEKAASRN